MHMYSFLLCYECEIAESVFQYRGGGGGGGGGGGPWTHSEHLSAAGVHIKLLCSILAPFLQR